MSPTQTAVATEIDFAESGGEQLPATAAAGGYSPPTTVQPASLLSAIVELALTPGLNKEILTLLMDRQADQERQQREAEFDDAMARCQAELQPIARTTENTQTKSKYAMLVDIDRAVRPIITGKYRFALSYNEAEAGPNNLKVTLHVSRNGVTRSFDMFAPPDTLGPKGTAVKTILHGIGSTTTYLRNKILCNAFNIVLKSDDDDGNRGGTNYINDVQIAELEDMLLKTSTHPGTWFDTLGVRDVTEITASQFTMARNTLLAKQRRDEQRRAKLP